MLPQHNPGMARRRSGLGHPFHETGRIHRVVPHLVSEHVRLLVKESYKSCGSVRRYIVGTVSLWRSTTVLVALAVSCLWRTASGVVKLLPELLPELIHSWYA